MIQLRVLGEIRLFSEDGTNLDALLRQPKRLALLAYLASPAPGAWHRRDMLLALFWPELDTAHGRTSLRNSLYVLRQTLGDDVVRNRGDEEISIDPEKLCTDLSIVWDALRGGRIDDALAGYGGELLPGLFPPDSEGFQRWLDSERTRLRVAVSTASMARIDELEQNGDIQPALATARKVSEINADDETVVRRIMTLHEAIGDRAGGLAAFESYRSRLASDFDAEPAPETMEVASRLRSATGSGKIRTTAAPKLATHVPSEAVAASREPSRNRSYGAVAAGALAIGAVIVAFSLGSSTSPEPASIGRSSPLTSEEGLQVEAAVSPNGRLVAYAGGNANRLRILVQRIDGGSPWPLSRDSVSVELMPRWSPDNDQILFLSKNNAYVAPTLGGSPRMVARGGNDDHMIRSASWSPTGDSIAIVRNDSLMVQPLRGTGARLVGRGAQLHSCVWSPDGKWIACVSGNWIAFTPGPLFGNEAPSSVVLFPASGGSAVALTDANFESESPAWSSDGRFLWMLSNRDGVSGEAYALPIGDDGRAAGDFVKLGMRAESIGVSAGRVAYSVPSKKANIWSIPIPRDTTLSIALATPVTAGNQVIELVSASRDSKWLVYDSNLRGNSDIYRIPIDGGEAEALTEDARQEFAAELSPDGSEIAWQRWVGGERHLFVKRLDSDAANEILPVRGDQGVPRWSHDGKALVAWSHNTERGAIFVMRRDASGKWSRASWRLDYGQLPIWMDDDEIAFLKLDGSVQSIHSDSGAVKTLYSPRAGSRDPVVTFIVRATTDPSTLWMLGQSGPDQGIWSLSLATGETRLLVRLRDPVGKSIGPAFTADSSRFYFALNERFSNIRWAELTNR